MHRTAWPTLLVLCRHYFNSVNPQGLIKYDSLSDKTFITPSVRAIHHKKVNQWFFNPGKFHSEIEASEKQHGGKCIYHLAKCQPTADYSNKKDLLSY
jgi:hypothetical protein